MKKIIGYLLLIVAVAAAIVASSTFLGIISGWLSLVFHLPKPNMPEYIFDGIWWKFVGSTIVTLASAKIILKICSSKKLG